MALYKFATTRVLAIILCALPLVALAADDGQIDGQNDVQIVSPDARVSLALNAQGGLNFRATFDGNKVFDSSPLGLTFEKSDPRDDLVIAGVESKLVDETRVVKIGRKSTVRDRYREATISLVSSADSKKSLQIVARVYDQGFAFRYVVPKDSAFADSEGAFRVLSEETAFKFADDFDARVGLAAGYNTNQETEYAPIKLSQFADGKLAVAPLLAISDKFVAALAESDLLDWSGANFAGTGSKTVKIALTPRDDGNGAVLRNAPAASPWRVCLLGKNERELYDAADLVQSLAQPCDFDASWIEPGVATWDWWAPKGSRDISTKRICEFIDFTAEMGWRYTLVDAGWYKTPPKNAVDSRDWSLGLEENPKVDLKKCVEYGASKGVRLIMWIDWPDLVATGHGDDVLKHYAKVGIAGVKIDHMNSHSQEMVAALTETVKLAADLKLLVNFHGMYVPTGLERTFPNQITREGIQGNEYFRSRPLAMSQVVALPFTRGLVGPADYTPGGFKNRHKETYLPLKKQTERDASCQVVGTRAHELALCMLIDSPLRCLCDLPEVYRDQPGLEYLRDLPTVWDDSVVVDAKIGEFVVIARRSGDVWRYSGATDDQPRRFDVPLELLEDGVEYEGVLYADAPESDVDACALRVESRVFTRDDRLVVDAAREGGWNLVLTPKTTRK